MQLSFFRVALSALALAACHSGSSAGPADGGNDLAGALVITPANATVAVLYGTPASEIYQVKNGASDVTSTCVFSVADASFGAFTSATLAVAARGGTTQVTATCGAQSASTSLTVNLSGQVLAMGAPSNAPALFTTATIGTDATHIPSIEYPIDGAVVPLNLPAIDTQWTAAQNDLFHLSIKSTHVALDLYTIDADGQFDVPTWSAIALSASGDSLSIVVDGLLQASPTTKYASTPVTLKMSKDSISNTALYFWASSQGNLLSQTFGMTTAPTVVKGDCTACHSLSRSGTRIGYSRCVGGDCSIGEYLGFLKSSATGWVDTMDANNKAYGGSYTTFAPVGYPFADDTQSVALAAVSSCNLELFDPDAGMPVTSNVATVSTHDGANPARCATMPDWSADGHTVVFASQPAAGASYVDVTSSAIATMNYSYAGGVHTFGEPAMIISQPITLPSGTYDNFFFPSFSPDGAYIVFDAARSAWRNLSDETVPGQRLMLTTPTGATTVELANMNGTGDTDITWPHWAPTDSGDYYWIVFSSERNYGHELTAANSNVTCQQNGTKQCKQIWIGAIDKSKLGTSGPSVDPSAPPMWMPGQDLTADNISPYWTVPSQIQ
jgi:Tol biopolymer transport system component